LKNKKKETTKYAKERENVFLKKKKQKNTGKMPMLRLGYLSFLKSIRAIRFYSCNSCSAVFFAFTDY